MTKYKEAARIANSALEAVIAACTAGANLVRSLPRCPHANSSAADDGTLNRIHSWSCAKWEMASCWRRWRASTRRRRI